MTAPGDPSDLDYFDIQPESGWIYLTRPLDVSHFLANLYFIITQLFQNVGRVQIIYIMYKESLHYPKRSDFLTCLFLLLPIIVLVQSYSILEGD